MRYVSIHNHSTFSFMDGFGLPKEHVARVADLEMRAMALTEHGNVSSHVKLEQAAQAAGVKPIFGLEAYTAPSDMKETKNQRKWHMTVLAMDLAGYHNLNRMVSRSWDEGFYRWPTVTGEILRDHHDGLIVTSGCCDGLVACSLLGGKGIDPSEASAERADAVIRRFKRRLGDRYYLEVQQFPDLQRTCQINTWLEEASRRHKVPLVATSDVHYPLPEQNEFQKILHAAGRSTGTVAAAEAEWEYNIRLTYPTSDAYLIERLRGTGLSRRAAELAIASTGEIADRCNVVLPKMERLRYPVSQEPDSSGLDAVGLMRRWLNDGWMYRGFNALNRRDRRAYRERVEYELNLFIEKDFVDYFLMLSDLVRRAKDNGLPVGPARGSAAASLVCYLLRITEVNPMEFPLMFFERFVDPNRMDVPDVDLDFDDERRDEIRQLAIQRYGEECVGNIANFTRYRGKNSLDDVARVYSIPRGEVERIKEYLVERSGGDSRFDATIEDTIEMFEPVKATFEKYPQLYRALGLEGNYRGLGVHAAGLVIGSKPLWEAVASYTKHNVGKQRKTLHVMSVDKYDGEHFGLLKVDALGLSTMGMLRHALEIAGLKLDDLYSIPLDDKPTLEAFRNADLTGIFQFEGRTMRIVTSEVKPETFMDLADINALARPGPLHSGSTAEYIAARHGRKEVEHLHPMVDEITKSTSYQIIYQEQMLQICREIGQFPWLHAAVIRKVISQKKGEAAFNELWDRFKDGAASQGISEEVADKIWRRMVTAGTYAFNVAHCISYSMLGYWCMWMKVHHPIAFYTASLRKTDPNDTDQMLAYMHDMQSARFGRSYKVYPPDLNRSSLTWEPADDGVVAGFLQIKGVGEAMAQAIIDRRDEVGEFSGWEDLQSIRGFGPKKMQMIMDFCLRDDPFGINWMRDEQAAIRKAIRNGEMPGVPLPDTLAIDIPYANKKSYHTLCCILKDKNLQDMFEDERARTGEELDPKKVRDPHLKHSMSMFMEDESGRATVKVNRWAYPRFQRQIWSIKPGYHFVVMKVVKKPFFGKTVHLLEMYIIEPDKPMGA